MSLTFVQVGADSVEHERGAQFEERFLLLNVNFSSTSTSAFDSLPFLNGLEKILVRSTSSARHARRAGSERASLYFLVSLGTVRIGYSCIAMQAAKASQDLNHEFSSCTHQCVVIACSVSAFASSTRSLNRSQL